jgi:hypothetical protein
MQNCALEKSTLIHDAPAFAGRLRVASTLRIDSGGQPAESHLTQREPPVQAAVPAPRRRPRFASGDNQ